MATSGERTEFAAAGRQFVLRIPRGTESNPALIHWSFDEGEGTILKARGSAENIERATGKLMASHSNEALPQWIEGVNGAALEFSGGGEWILTEHRGLHRESDRTVAGWVRIPSDFGKGDPAPVMSWGLVDERPVVGHVWMLSLGRYFARRPKTFGRLWLSLGDQQIMGTTDLRDGKWHHVAAVLMNREEGPAALLYVDGNLENVQRNTIEPVETADGARKSEAIRFGRMIHYDQFYLRGGLDEFYLFDAALSGDQVRALMRGKTPKATTDP